MALPGDDLVPAPMVQTTHAVTINAPPQRVWPWLVQTGQGRAGFYSDSRFWDRSVDWYYRRLSRKQPGKEAVGYHVAASDRIVPAWQNPHVGDIIVGRLGQPITLYGRPNQTSHGSCSPTRICGIWFRPAFVTAPGLASSARSATAAC